MTKDGRPFGKIKRSKATKLVPTVQYIRESPTYSELEFKAGSIYCCYYCLRTGLQERLTNQNLVSRW